MPNPSLCDQEKVQLPFLTYNSFIIEYLGNINIHHQSEILKSNLKMESEGKNKKETNL